MSSILQKKKTTTKKANKHAYPPLNWPEDRHGRPQPHALHWDGLQAAQRPALRSQAAQSGSGTGNGELISRDQHRFFRDTTEKGRRDQPPSRLQTTESAD